MTTATPSLCGRCGAPVALGATSCRYCHVAFAPTTPGAEPGARMATAPRPEADPWLLELLARGALIDAIKRYRELTGLGLREAKRAVEDLVKLRTAR
ncbi:MAG: hypothetical protein LC118_17985 [Dehalococcoidia bacterium]|nr:hypothetical protein [Dehalococcoidia bacterium]